MSSTAKTLTIQFFGNTYTVNKEDLTPIEISFTLPLEGKEREFILKEAGCGGIARWRGFIFKHSKAGDGKHLPFSDEMAQSQIILLSQCLYERVTKPNGDVTTTLCSEATVKTIPYRVQRKLFSIAQTISDLEESVNSPEEDEEKNLVG